MLSAINRFLSVTIPGCGGVPIESSGPDKVQPPVFSSRLEGNHVKLYRNGVAVPNNTVEQSEFIGYLEKHNLIRRLE